MRPPIRPRRPKAHEILIVSLAAIAAAETCRIRRATATDRFEIQVYEGDINEPGQVGLELHSNVVSPRLPGQGLWRNTFEPSFGVLSWWELGAYFQVAAATSAVETYFGGFKLRSKFVVPRARTGDFVLGLNLELGRGGAALGEPDWDTEFRPILGYARGRLLLAINPIFGWAVTGHRHRAPDFEPAAKARWQALSHVGLGVEYYAGLGLTSHPLPRAEQEHVVYVVADVLDASFDLNLGVGRGLTEAVDPWTFKLILGLEF
jgi:hypothetical protein